MQITYLFIALLLFCHLISTHSKLVRAPLTKRPRQKKSSTSPTRKLSTFNGSMGIADFGDIAYAATINIGSDSQSFTFQLDTGSATMWIPGNPYTGEEVGGAYFNCQASSTCVQSNVSLNVSYGVGFISGNQIQDQIQLGGLTIPSFEMVLVSDASDLEGNVDGLIGLGLTRDPQTQLPTVLETLKQYNLIDVGMFSMYLGFDPSDSGSDVGEIIFGGYDPQYAVSDFTFLNVENTTATNGVYWQTNISAIGYGWNQNLTSSSNSIIFDSGTSYILLTEALFYNFFSAASAQGISFEYSPYTGTFSVDCSDVSDLQPLTFFFEGATFNVSSANYVYDLDGFCSLAVSTLPSDISDDAPLILGDTFLANYYVLYTADNYTVGLADALPVPTTTSFPVWAIVLIVLGSFLSIAAFLYFCCQAKNRTKQNDSDSSRPFAGNGMPIGTSYNSSNPPGQGTAFGGRGLAIGGSNYNNQAARYMDNNTSY